ncbi:MAG TPA: tyrosine-type recombinase/integrase [Polyangiaceae bacterium]|nr:tyrosine-type recombinase/integrase [Polyangiaceae bacterium]
MAKPVKHRGKWRIRWFDENDQRQSEVHDDYRVAQAKLREHEVEVDQIREGLRPREARDKTFNELCDYWIENRAPLKRSGKDDESVIRKHLRPAFGTMRVRDIGVEDGDAYVLSHAILDPKTVSNHLTLLLSMLRLATSFKIPWILNVPRLKKPKTSLFSRDFNYLRTDEEIRRFLNAAQEEGEQVFVLYATAIYTGMRAGELAALEWGDIDLERRLITVQRSFDGPTKSDRVRHVPILDALLPILRSWRLRHPGKLLFTNERGGMYAESGRVFQEVLHRVLDAAAFLKIKKRGGKERRYVVFHDLRHTFASQWVMKGGDVFKLQRILGHQSVQMTMRYAHLAPDAFVGDYGRLGSGHSAGSAEVVPIASSR